MNDERIDQISETQIINTKNKIDFKQDIFVPNIKHILQKKGLTQSDLAKKLNTTNQQISSWLNPNKSVLPDLINTMSIAKALNVSLDDLCKNANRSYSISSDRDICQALIQIFEYTHLTYDKTLNPSTMRCSFVKNGVTFHLPSLYKFFDNINTVIGCIDVVEHDRFMAIMGQYIDGCLDKKR